MTAPSPSTSSQFLTSDPKSGDFSSGSSSMAAAGGARGMAAASRAMMSLMSTGAKLVEAAASRERVISYMQGYADRLSLDLATLPPVIHIAGTKGKGSTASMVESILRSKGLKTGLYTSPHLIDVRERFRLGGSPVPEELYLKHFWAAWDALQAAAEAQSPPGSPKLGSDDVSSAAALPAMPGFFHFLTLLAFKIFRDAAVDVAVLEVGMGGRLDATNVVPASSVAVCGVTTLDFDHMDTLGHTLAEIAGEKAGIFKPSVPAISVPQRADAMARLCSVAAAVGSPLMVAEPSLVLARSRLLEISNGSDFPVSLGLAGQFQRTNAALAVALAEAFLARRHGDAALSAAASAAFSTSGAGAQPSSIIRNDSSSATADETAGDAARAKEVGALISKAAAALGTSESPAPYALSAPLAPYVLRGLQNVRWSGRAQVVDVPIALPSSDSASASIAGQPPLRLFVDGAHTERSLQACVGWFRQQVGLPLLSLPGSIVSTDSAAVSAADVRGSQAVVASDAKGGACDSELVLLFYCGTEKDALQLLLPLSTIPFDRVIITAPDWVRPSRHAMPTTQQALTQFLEKKRRMGDERAISDIEAAARDAGIPVQQLWSSSSSDSVSSSAGECASSATSGVGKDPRWLQTLADLWAAVHVRPEFGIIRRRLARPMEEYTSPSSPSSSSSSSGTSSAVVASPSAAGGAAASDLGNSNGDLPLPSIAPPVHIAHSISDALQLLKADAQRRLEESRGATTSSTSSNDSSGATGDRSRRPLRVLVTGSLYLVGGVLQAAGWREE